MLTVRDALWVERKLIKLCVMTPSCSSTTTPQLAVAVALVTRIQNMFCSTTLTDHPGD